LDAGIGLVKTARAVARRILFTVRFNGDCNSPEHVQQLDQIASQIARISPAVDEFVTTLYPPVDKQAASQRVTHSNYFVAVDNEFYFHFLAGWRIVSLFTVKPPIDQIQSLCGRGR
jgi:Grap2 and cyclin-D-interacting